MTARTGFEAWRERNLSLPYPDEFRIMRDESVKAVWRDLEQGWYSLYVDFTWDRNGAPLGGDGAEEAIGQPDYWSRALGIPDERVLTNVLAGYA